MQSRITCRRFVPAALCALLFAMPALAQTPPEPQPTPGEVAQECVEAMRQTVGRTSNAMRARAEHGIHRMRRLAHEGAPPVVLAEVASETIERINGVADEGRDRVRRIAAHCVRRLRAMEAPPELIRHVVEAKDRAIGAINENASHARHAVRRALHALVGGTRPDGPSDR